MLSKTQIYDNLFRSISENNNTELLKVLAMTKKLATPLLEIEKSKLMLKSLQQIRVLPLDLEAAKNFKALAENGYAFSSVQLDALSTLERFYITRLLSEQNLKPKILAVYTEMIEILENSNLEQKKVVLWKLAKVAATRGDVEALGLAGDLKSVSHLFRSPDIGLASCATEYDNVNILEKLIADSDFAFPKKHQQRLVFEALNHNNLQSLEYFKTQHFFDNVTTNKIIFETLKNFESDSASVERFKILQKLELKFPRLSKANFGLLLQHYAAESLQKLAECGTSFKSVESMLTKHILPLDSDTISMRSKTALDSPKIAAFLATAFDAGFEVPEDSLKTDDFEQYHFHDVIKIANYIKQADNLSLKVSEAVSDTELLRIISSGIIKSTEDFIACVSTSTKSTTKYSRI